MLKTSDSSYIPEIMQQYNYSRRNSIIIQHALKIEYCAHMIKNKLFVNIIRNIDTE